MTLFVSLPGRRYEISDAYVMALTFILFFSVTRVVQEVIKKRKKSKEEVKLPNPRGGGTTVQLSDDTELALTILSCIADNESYLVKSPKIKELVFNLAKEKIKNESLVITPNVMRFLALKLINPDQTLIVKIGNIVLSSSNRARLLVRIMGSAAIGIIGALFATLPYAILLVILYFNGTENCGYNCDAHFEHLSQEAPISIHADDSVGHLVISDNNEARQVQIYTPSGVEEEVISTTEDHKVISRKFERSRKKAKEVKFSDFKERDPVLSKFKDLPEPDIPQTPCLINDVHDVIGIRID